METKALPSSPSAFFIYFIFIHYNWITDFIFTCTEKNKNSMVPSFFYERKFSEVLISTIILGKELIILTSGQFRCERHRKYMFIA